MILTQSFPSMASTASSCTITRNCSGAFPASKDITRDITSTDWVLTELSFHSFWPSSSKAVKTPTCWLQQENIYGRRTMASHFPLMRTIHSDFCLSHLHLFTVCIKPLSSAAYQKMLFCCTQAWWCSLIKTAIEQRHGGPVQYPLQNWFCVSAYTK